METNVFEVMAERNLVEGTIWGRSGVWERRMELGARIEKGGKKSRWHGV